MRRIGILFLILSLLLTGCGRGTTSEENSTKETSVENTVQVDDDLGDVSKNYKSLNDENLLQYVEDNIYSELSVAFNSEDYNIEDVSSVYISNEYLDELDYNSKSNIYFGYTLEEIESQFDGEKYVFTCDDEGKTVISECEKYDDTYEKVIRNVAIGTGVILICVTVSVVTAGVGMPAVSAVFAASAKTGMEFAISSSLISGAASAIVTGIKTKDVKKTVAAASLSASESFKWGAIIGVVTGGVSKALKIHKAARTAKSIPSYKESETYASSIYKGKEQVSYLNGKKVNNYTSGATRPDIVVNKGNGKIEAIEVKNYDLASENNRNNLYSELKRQVTNRIVHLPKGSTQKIVLDVRGRGYSKDFVLKIIKSIQYKLKDVYANIPVEVLQG